MSDDMRIKPLNDTHIRSIGIVLGMSGCLRTLYEARPTHEKLPGFNTAIAIIEAVEAQYRAEVAGMNFRAATAAGVDIQTHMIGMKGAGVIYAEPMDLEGLAQFSPEPQE